MFRVLQYYGRYQSARGALGGLPAWARWLVFLAAIPGIILLLLSAFAFFVSLFVLLLLAVPVYRLASWVSGPQPEVEAFQAPLGGVDFVEPAEFVPLSSEAHSSDHGTVVMETTVSESASEAAVQLTPVPRQGRRQIEVRIVEP